MSFLQKIRALVVAHKIITGIIAIALLWGGYTEYKSLTNTSNETRYVLSAAQKGTLIIATTGTGQVSSSNQIDIKPKVSGDVILLNVTSGDGVKQGALIAEIDPTDAQKAVRDAQVNLDSAKLSLAKLIQPADQLSLTQAQNALAKANESKQNTQNDLAKAYDDGFTSIANTFLTLPSIMTGVQNILYTSDPTLAGANGQENISFYADRTAQVGGITSDEALNFKNATDTSYTQATTDYNLTFSNYKTTTRSSDPAVLEKLIDQSYTTTTEIADAVKNASNLIQL